MGVRNALKVMVGLALLLAILFLSSTEGREWLLLLGIAAFYAFLYVVLPLGVLWLIVRIIRHAWYS